MENNKIKKVKKKKSSSAIIKSLRERLSEYKEWSDKLRRKLDEKRCKLEEIERHFPKKYFKIIYKAKADNGSIQQFTNIVEDFCAQMAIIQLKDDCYEFRLVDIQVLT